MKNWFLFLVLIAFAPLANAQMHAYNAAIQEDAKMMSKGTQNAFSIELPNITEKVAEEVWKKFSKTYDAKSKRDRKTREYFAEDAKINEMGSNPIDIYTTFSELEEGTMVNFWFDLGGAFLSSELHDAQVSAANTMLQSYAFAVGKKQAEDELKAEEKAQKELEKELEKLVKDNKEYHKKIEEAKELITKMENNIKTNEQDQEKKQTEIGAQKEVVKTKGANLAEYN